MRDYYEILGVERGASDAALKSAFYKLAKEHHPDRNDGCQEAAGRFKEVNEAYSVLSDKQKRAAYDRFGHAGVNGGNGGGFADMNDIFNAVFGDGFGDMFGRAQQQRRPAGPTRGADLRYDLEISLEQAYAGANVEVKVPAALTCDDCKGSGCAPGASPQNCVSCAGQGRVRASQGFFTIERTCARCGGAGRVVLDPCKGCSGHGQVRRERTLEVRVPPGVDDGARIRLAGEGDAGAKGGPRGDLYMFLSVRPHELFERDGLDLLCTAPVPMATATLGGAVEVPCLLGGENCDGQCKIEVQVPEGAQSGSMVRVRGRGMPSLRSREKGDLVVELMIETPTKLTARQKELMREFAGLCGEQQHPRTASFFGKAKRFWDGVARTN